MNKVESATASLVASESENKRENSCLKCSVS